MLLDLVKRAPVEVLTERLIAHRGLHDETVPENSLAAFAAAADAGYAIECDVHVTDEGIPVVFHDRTLARMCELSETIDRVTRALLPSTRLRSSDECIPTLREVLDQVAGRVPVYIDLQLPGSWAVVGRRSWRATCEAVGATLEGYEGAVGIMAWDPRQLRWFAERMPEVLRIQSGGVVAEMALLPGVASLFDNLRVTRFSKPHAISYNASRLPRRAVARSRDDGLPVLAWTVRSAVDLERLRGYADSAIFEGFRPHSSPDLEGARKGRLALLAGSLRRSLAAMKRFDHTILMLTLVAGVALSVLAAGVALLVGASAVLAAWQPRRWLVVAAAGGSWPLLAGVAADTRLALVAIPCVFAASLLGASARCVRLPRRY
jgi:glycerophosphoryl diester phosphodiesterase